MLWLYSRQQFNTDIEVQNKIGVVLTIKIFLIIEINPQALKDVPLIVKDFIHSINMYGSDSIKIFSTPINSVENTPKKIYLGGPLWDEFTLE